MEREGDHEHILEVCEIDRKWQLVMYVKLTEHDNL